MSETERLALLTKDGPGVHRDLCHVARIISLKEMDSVRLPLAPPGQAAAASSSESTGASSKGCVFFYVLQGKVQVRTRHREAFAVRLEAASRPSRSSSVEEGRLSEGGQDASEEEMLALFNSIDVDGSGAIDVEELQTALEMLGIHKSEEEVAELMDGVNEDGSGELEFAEFKEILHKATRGGGTRTEWRELGGEGAGAGAGAGPLWCQELSAGASAGEAAVLDPVPMAQDAMVMALDTTELMVLERADYEHILENGFDGELKAKIALIRSASIFCEKLRRTDLRTLAYAMVRRTLPMHAAVYEQGAAPTSLDLILEGHCKLVVKLPASGGGEPPRTPRGSLAGTALRDGTASGSGMTHGSHDGRGAQQHPHAGAHGHHSKGHHGHGHHGHSGSQRPAGGSGGSAEEQGPGQGDGEWGLGMAAAGAVSRLRGLPHFNRAARARKLDLAVLGPGDVCSETALLGPEERHPHSAVVSSQELVLLSLAVRDMRRMVHPADQAALREYVVERAAERAGRLAVATNVAAVAAGELARLRKVAAAVGDAPAPGAGAQGQGAEAAGGGEGDSRPGTPAALERLAAVMRGKTRPSCNGAASFASGLGSGALVRRTATGLTPNANAPVSELAAAPAISLSGTMPYSGTSGMSYSGVSGLSYSGVGAQLGSPRSRPVTTCGIVTSGVGAGGANSSPFGFSASPAAWMAGPWLEEVGSAPVPGPGPGIGGHAATQGELLSCVAGGWGWRLTDEGRGLDPQALELRLAAAEALAVRQEALAHRHGHVPGTMPAFLPMAASSEPPMEHSRPATRQSAAGSGGGCGGGSTRSRTPPRPPPSVDRIMLALDAPTVASRTGRVCDAGITGSTTTNANNTTSTTPATSLAPSPLPSARNTYDGMCGRTGSPVVRSSMMGPSALAAELAARTPSTSGMGTPVPRTPRAPFSVYASAGASAGAQPGSPRPGHVSEPNSQQTQRAVRRLKAPLTAPGAPGSPGSGTPLQLSSPDTPAGDGGQQQAALQQQLMQMAADSHATATGQGSPRSRRLQTRGQQPPVSQPPGEAEDMLGLASSDGEGDRQGARGIVPSDTGSDATGARGNAAIGDGDSAPPFISLPSLPSLVGVISRGGSAEAPLIHIWPGGSSASTAEVEAEADAGASHLSCHVPQEAGQGPAARANHRDRNGQQEPRGSTREVPSGGTSSRGRLAVNARVHVNGQLGAGQDALQHCTAAAELSSLTLGAHGQLHKPPKWSVARYPRALAEGLAVLDEHEAAVQSAVQAASAAVQTASAALVAAGGPRHGAAGAGFAASAVAGSAPKPQPPVSSVEIICVTSLADGLTAAAGGLARRRLDLPHTPPMSPMPSVGDDELDELYPQSQPRVSDGDSGDDWDLPMMPHPPSDSPRSTASGLPTDSAPAGATKSEGFSLQGMYGSTGTAGTAAAGACRASAGAVGNGGRSAWEEAGAAARMPGTGSSAAKPNGAQHPSEQVQQNQQQAHHLCPRPPAVPRLALHKLRDSQSSAPSGRASAEYPGAAPEGSVPASATAGGEEAADVTVGGWAGTPPPSAPAIPLSQPPPSAKTVVGSVKLMMRGWHTARERSAAAEGPAPAPAPAPGHGAMSARDATPPGSGGGGGAGPGAAAGSGSLSARGAGSGAAGGGGGGGGVGSWSAEAISAAIAAAQGEKSRLAAIYSGMLRHGEAAMRGSVELGLVQQRQQQQQQASSGQRRLHRTNSASTLVPTPRAAWSHTAAWAGARANPLPHVDLPAAAAGGGGSFSCTTMPTCHSPHYRDTSTPATSPSPLRRSCNTVGAGHDRLFRSSTVPLQQQALSQAQTQLLQSIVSTHASASPLNSPTVSLSPRLANLLGGVGQGARGAVTDRGQRPGTREERRATASPRRR